jgi:hypothetical protein
LETEIVYLTPTRRFAPTSPLQGEVNMPHCRSLHQRIAFLSPECQR